MTFFLRYNAIDDDATYRSLNHLVNETAVFVEVLNHYLDECVQVALALVVGNDGLFRTIERKAFALCSGTNLCDIVETEHHVL